MTKPTTERCDICQKPIGMVSHKCPDRVYDAWMAFQEAERRFVRIRDGATSIEPPDDVMEWVRETYKPEGVEVWLTAYHHGTAQTREYMERLARTPSGGT